MNGKPHNARLAITKQDEAVGIWLDKFPIHRRSWLCIWPWINLPAQTKRSALNKACVIIWKKAKCTIF